MSFLDAIPGVSQAKSFVQWVSGDEKGATRTQENFSKWCPVVSQARSAVEATYDTDQARRTQESFRDNFLEPAADGTPGVGHVKGAVHYALGDRKKGDESMKAASRTTAVAGAAVLTGGVGGGVVAGGANLSP